MPKLIEITNQKTYGTRERAIQAVEKLLADREDVQHLRYFIYTNPEGRFIPVFIGTDCMSYGIQFRFNVIG